LRFGLRVAYLLAAALLLLILPIGDAAVMLALFVAVDLAAAALLLSRPAARPQPALVAIGDDSSLQLYRRTVPALRSRRPAAIIEAQIAWRQAAEYRRRRSITVRRTS